MACFSSLLSHSTKTQSARKGHIFLWQNQAFCCNHFIFYSIFKLKSHFYVEFYMNYSHLFLVSVLSATCLEAMERPAALPIAQQGQPKR